MPAETAVKHRDLRGHSDAHRCCGKSLIGECVGAFRCASARAAGIYFQACAFNHSDISPSLESTSCERSDADYRTRWRRRRARVDRVSIQQLAGERSASPLELCQTVKSCQPTYSVSALPPACLAQSRAGTQILILLQRALACDVQCVGTRRFNSSNQFCTTVMLLGALVRQADYFASTSGIAGRRVICGTCVRRTSARTTHTNCPGSSQAFQS